MEVNYENVVGIDFANELIGIGEKATEFAFRIGDIANQCIAINKAVGNKFTNQTVYAAVGSFCGRKSRTIRYYADIAVFYPPLIRKEYEVLKFDHFRFAAQYTNWREILEYAVSQVDELGRPASVDALVAKFATFKPVESPENEIVTKVDDLKKIVYQFPMPGELRRSILDALERFREEVEKNKIPSF